MFLKLLCAGAAATLILFSVAAHAACTPAISDDNLIAPGELQLSINPTNPPQQFVDKDGQPHWDPATLEGVTPATLDAIFIPLPADQEWSPLPTL